MKVIYDIEKLKNLLNNLYAITGICYNIVDTSANLLFVLGHNEFCEHINSNKEGHARCVECDLKATKIATMHKGIYTYRCHANLCETIIPIYEKGDVIAFFFFGQILDDSSIEEQWSKTKDSLHWYPNISELKPIFYKLQRFSHKDALAHAELLKACTHYILMERMIKSVGLSDIQKLDEYLNNNLSSKLSLDVISNDLGICKTKLCALASKLEPGKTMTRIITEKRIASAKTYLQITDYSISKISEIVGISDYNYFTKLFKSVEGISPREYRKSLHLSSE